MPDAHPFTVGDWVWYQATDPATPGIVVAVGHDKRRPYVMFKVEHDHSPGAYKIAASRVEHMSAVDRLARVAG